MAPKEEIIPNPADNFKMTRIFSNG